MSVSGDVEKAHGVGPLEKPVHEVGQGNGCCGTLWASEQAEMLENATG